MGHPAPHRPTPPPAPPRWRVACVRIPRFPVGAAWLAAGPGHQLSLDLGPAPAPAGRGGELHWDEQLLAVLDGPRLRAVSAAAGRARIRPGMTGSQARARCSRLTLLPWDEIAISGARTRVTAALVQASPQVAPAAGPAGLWWVGATGFDGLGGERQLATTLRDLARRWHPQARVAIADSCVAARAATWVRPTGAHDGTHRVQPGGDAAFLAPLPLAFLPLEPDTAAALTALGLHSVGAFAALASADVEQRWGAAGLAAWRLAQGDDHRRPVLARLEADRSITTELGGSSETMEPVLFLVRAALDTLLRDLAREGYAAAALQLTLLLDGGQGQEAAVTREVRPAQPLARLAPLFERCRALLDTWAMPAPISGVTVRISQVVPARGEQGDLLDTGWRDPGAAFAALERLRATLGPGCVVRPVSRDAHAPEEAGAWVELVDGDDAERAAAARTAQQAVAPRADDAPLVRPTPTLPVAVRLLETPAVVQCTCAATGRPMHGQWGRDPFTVLEALGPERVSGGWWRAPVARDYWRLVTRELGTLLVYREAAGWRVAGWCD